jgi:hypothetical protein
MRYTSQSLAAAGALTALVGTTSAQYTLADKDVPYIGGGVYQANDPALADYEVSYTPPFDPSVYDGYYSWAVNNNTVGINNMTAQIAPLGITGLGNSSNTYPFFIVNEGKPKPIIAKHGKMARDKCTDNKQDKPGQFKKILHLIFENEVYSWTMEDTWWKLLARRGKLLTNSHGITHPSLPNYATFLAGDFFGIADEDFYNINTTTIYDLLDEADIDYATYVEQYTPLVTKRGPNDCNNNIFLGPLDSTNPDWTSPTYRRLDVPALLFSTYTTSYERCSKIYNATAQFDDDVFSKKLPPYSYYVPDMLHNGHDPEADSDYVHQSTTSGIWLNAFLDMYLPALTEQGTLVVATWDEATWKDDSDSTPNNDNHIATLLFGSGVTPNTQDDTYVTHYAALRAVINNFGLGSLGRNDTNATNGDLSSLIN